MQRNRRTWISWLQSLSNTALVVFTLGCGEDGVTSPEESACAANDPMQSQAGFDATRNCTGSAQGSAFSGTYATTLRNIRFSNECTVAFVRRWDFFVNTGASESELQQVLRDGYPEQNSSVAITQNGGQVRVNGEGDGVESELAGWIDATGKFRALAGQYVNARDYAVALYDGTVAGKSLTGAFAVRLTKLDDARAPGSCTFSADLVGSRR